MRKRGGKGEPSFRQENDLGGVGACECRGRLGREKKKVSVFWLAQSPFVGRGKRIILLSWGSPMSTTRRKDKSGDSPFPTGRKIHLYFGQLGKGSVPSAGRKWIGGKSRQGLPEKRGLRPMLLAEREGEKVGALMKGSSVRRFSFRKGGDADRS